MLRLGHSHDSEYFSETTGDRDVFFFGSNGIQTSGPGIICKWIYGTEVTILGIDLD